MHLAFEPPAAKRQDVIDLKTGHRGRRRSRADAHRAPELPSASVARSIRSRRERRCSAGRLPVVSLMCTGRGLNGRKTRRSRGSGHSSRSALAPLAERADAAADGCRLGCVANEHVAEPPAGAAPQALVIGDRAVRLGEPPKMQTGHRSSPLVAGRLKPRSGPAKMRGQSSSQPGLVGPACH